MSDSIVKNKAKELAKQIIFLCRELKSNHTESVLINQVLRSGTSIGANLHESQYAQGTKDFLSKLEISLKECHETEYWLQLLYETNSITHDQYQPLKNSCGQIRRMLISTITTIKSKEQK